MSGNPPAAITTTAARARNRPSMSEAPGSPPPSPPRLSSSSSGRNSSYTTEDSRDLNEIANIMSTSRNATATTVAKAPKPKLAVSASGRFEDQFYHAQEASRTMGIFKNRTIVKKTAEKQRTEAPKRKKSMNVNGRDVEQFSDADIIYAGYLVKQGSFWKTWRRRYFILRRDINVLAYYTSQENLVKLGEIVIDAETVVTPPKQSDKAFPGRFMVEHSGRKLVLVAEEGHATAEMWAMVINRCITMRAAEAQAAEASLLAAQGSSERETMRLSLMQLRLSANGSSLAATELPKKRTSGGGAGLPALVDSPHSEKKAHFDVASSTVTSPAMPPAAAAASETTLAAKMKRHSTDSRLIQSAAEEAVALRVTSIAAEEERDRIVRNARLKSIDSANVSARKLLSTTIVKAVNADTPIPALKSQRLFRSFSAGSVLSSRSTSYDHLRVLHDDCGLLSTKYLSGGKNNPNSSQKFRSSDGGQFDGDDISESTASRARNLSLPGFRPVPSVELSISVGCRGPQDISHMLVVMSAVSPDSRGEMKELGRTEVQGSLALRACGVDFFARDFSALLSVPIKGSHAHMLQFDLYSVVNSNSESLSAQQALGLVRIPHVDLLFSGDSTLVLEVLRSDTSPSKQAHFLVIDRIRPSESLNLGHSYTYAKRHFVADIVPGDLRTSSSDDMFLIKPSKVEKSDSGNRSSFEMALAPTDAAGTDSKPKLSSLTYGSMIRGAFDSVEPTQVFVSEELSVSYCSISVAAKYMNLLQQRNMRRIHDAKLLIRDIEKKYERIPSSPNSRTEAQDVINLHQEIIRDAEARVSHYMKLYDAYVECEDYYEALLTMLEEGKEPGITGCLKRSTQKKDKRVEFMPTNLNCHVVRARRVALSSATRDPSAREKSLDAKGDELVYAVTTHGCPAAHCLGFKDGGLRRLKQILVQTQECKKDDTALLERIEQRQDVVRCQILSIASASFLTVIGLAANQSARHQERLQLMCQTGFMLNMESLLSTIKNEKGMIEDMYEGVQWLNSSVSLHVVRSMEEHPKLKCAKCVAITCSENGDNVVATFALPSDVFATLPDVLRHGHALKVHSVMFTQGINEMQSVANHVLDTSLQDEINLESANRLVRYFEVYKTHVLAMQPPNPDRVSDLSDLEIEIKILAEKLNQARKSHVQKKNVNILIESSDLCRRLGAGRSTCCKSGKDRTAMSVTLECSRLLVDKFHVKQGVHLCNSMRERGVRRVNVLANTGKAKFAFNSFQLKYLPDCYRPPVLTADSSVQS